MLTNETVDMITDYVYNDGRHIKTLIMATVPTLFPPNGDPDESPPKPLEAVVVVVAPPPNKGLACDRFDPNRDVLAAVDVPKPFAWSN